MFKHWVSNNRKSTYNIFDIHPIFKREIPDGDIGTVCCCDLEDAKVVMH